MQSMNVLCGQNEDLLIVEEGATYRLLKVNISF
jgi:hypothetical protein